MDFKVGSIVVLTGAGFTRNFGGYLGRDFFTILRNSSVVRSNPKIKDLISEYASSNDFESFYADVIDGNSYTEPEKSSLTEAVIKVYRDLHLEIKSFMEGYCPSGFFPYATLNQLIQCINHAQTKNFFFTLNQDLFFEMTFHWSSPKAPPLGNFLRTNAVIDLEFSQIERIDSSLTLNNILEGISDHAGPPYIKLHGSYGWFSSDGKHRIVLGRNKPKQLEQEPLLASYLSVFREVLQDHAPLKILVIGYGFRDPHVNEALANSIQKGSRLFVINPTSRCRFEKDLNVQYGNILLNGIECYYPWTLYEIFLTPRSAKWLMIKNDLEL